MRQVCYSVAMSLDGYIAGPNGEYDWIVMDPEIDFGALMARFDTLLVGRRTWDGMKGQGGPGMPGMETWVFSTTLGPDDCKGAKLSDSATDTVAKLRAGEGREIWLFGGGSLFRSLLDAGLVDRVEVAVIPVILGGGVPLLPEGARQRLRLEGSQVYDKTGTVWLRYSTA